MSKYSPLRRYLLAKAGPEADMAFGEIEGIVGGLPASARRWSAWWANEVNGRHVQARAWMDAGWLVSDVDLSAERVRFTKSK